MKNKMTYGPEFLSVIKSVDIDSNDWDTIKFMKSICMLLGDDSAPVLTFLLNNEEDYIRETVREIIKELGTDIVTVKMIKTTKADADPDERVFIFKGSDPKYLPKGERGSGKGSRFYFVFSLKVLHTLHISTLFY